MRLRVRALFQSIPGEAERVLPFFREYSRKGKSHCSGNWEISPFAELDVNQRPEHDCKRRGKEQPDHSAAHQHHEEVADPDRNAIVGLDCVVRKRIAEQVTAIERRDGEEIEETERQVDPDCECTEQDHGLECAGHFLKKAALKDIKNEIVAVGRSDGNDSEDEKGNEGEEQVRGGPGEGGEIVVADNLIEVAGEDRSGLGPADQQAAEKGEADEGAEDDECGKKECADGVDVVNWVERHTAQLAGCVIAETGGRPRVSAFVDAEREKKQHELEDCNNDGARLQARTPEDGNLRVAWGVERAATAEIGSTHAMTSSPFFSTNDRSLREAP
jgi:hypothetical protein